MTLQPWTQQQTSFPIFDAPGPGWLRKYPSLSYVAPFGVFIGLLTLDKIATVSIAVLYPVQLIAVLAVLLLCSRNVIDFRLKNAFGSMLLGVAVFVVWIGPDLLWPNYRSHWLFSNSLTGTLSHLAAASVRSSASFILFRSFGCIILVPIIEELFWRGWLPRWMIDSNHFQRVPLGAYTAFSFWIGSAAFASEHGPFWAVGLLAGIAYNWWMCRNKSVADCTLAHAITNSCLSAYVLVTGHWEYWL
jgi:CAAX prenyl protease-like protein